MKWLRAMMVCLIGLSLVLAMPVSATSVGYRDNELVIIDEPGDANKSYVQYYNGDKLLSLDDITWVDGYDGQGVALNGDGHLLMVNHLPLSISTCTFTAWIQWNGDEVNGEPAPNQHFFSFYRPNLSLLTVYPNAVDENGNSLGNRLVLTREQKKGIDMEYSLSDVDGNPIAWETGEWHHLAIVIDGTDLKYYIDGELRFQELWMLDFAQLRFSYLLIGDNIEEHPTLNAVLDEMSLYDVALSQEKIQRLMAGIEITDETTPTPTTTQTTTTETTTTTTFSTTSTEFERDVTDWTSPTTWIPIIVTGVALILVIVCWPYRNKPKHMKKIR